MHEVAQLSHCPHFHLNSQRVSGSSAQSSSIEQVYPSRNASISVWGEATVLIAQHFGSIPLSLCHMGGVERGPMMAQVPTASVGQSTRGSAPEASMQISYNHLGYSQ